MIYLPDTNVYSVFLRQKDERLFGHFNALLPSIVLSSVALMELEYGAAKSGLCVHRTRVDQLVAMLGGAIAFDANAAREAGRIRAYLARLRPNAQLIGPYDVLLAGHALSIGATLVTANRREFDRVPGLTVESWQTE
ncbi:MAG: PIN domain-containing protein [Opitutaceae bacterium]|nr:PIN domain-containing protein [Opitutaceae bacterium]